MVKVGIIGGSGLDNPGLLNNFQEINVDTPYGKPSSSLITGRLDGIEVVILSRHGPKHSIMPSNVPFRANIYALKKQGCNHILATTAVGSLKEEIKPGDLVFLDQFIDHTKRREVTFFDNSKVVHLPAAEPFCLNLRELLWKEAGNLGFQYHDKGTVITIEGPRFSTKAESHLFRQWGADVVNMSTVPEVNLAMEARMCYASIAMSTDWDCWKLNLEPVTFEEIMRVMNNNAEKVKKLILNVLPKINNVDCACKSKVNEEI